LSPSTASKPPASDENSHTAPVIAAGQAEATPRARMPKRGQYEGRAEDEAAPGHTPPVNPVGIATPILRVPPQRRSWRSRSHDPACTCPPCVALREIREPAENADAPGAEKQNAVAIANPQKRRIPHLQGAGSFGGVSLPMIARLPDPALRVAIVLQGSADPDGVVRKKSVSHLAEQAKRSPRTVHNALEWLRVNGFLEGKGVRGNGVPTEFRMLTSEPNPVAYVLFSLLRNLSDTLLRVYLVLAGHVNFRRGVFLNKSTIATKAGYDPKSNSTHRIIGKALHDLEARGVVTRKLNTGKHSNYSLPAPITYKPDLCKSVRD
jgi:hypothetical protein